MSIKIERAFAKANIPNMPMVRRHILNNLEKVGANLDKLSSTEIGYIIKALHIGYLDSKHAQQADYMSDMDCVWIGGDVQKLVPIPALREMIITTKKEPGEILHTRTYKMDYTEKF